MKGIYSQLKTLLDTAVHISPLALLRRVTDGLGRKALIEVSARVFPNAPQTLTSLADSGASYWAPSRRTW